MCTALLSSPNGSKMVAEAGRPLMAANRLPTATRPSSGVDSLIINFRAAGTTPAFTSFARPSALSAKRKSLAAACQPA
eukprot:CAMPEP_0204262322 /NCGR_PEP_ID=MMETSP0468-20130131/7599_1 /ASSEMBLY_ACC=CAM_ASM_000383 /TAXON_ID=2969 /ORGANISM="Oxyrrhis marina" /LENGTH=77 /DNA_ID=CAMNT_0051236975 /DNA_START=167 /DNA_END=400 /DNA_ORIENTATION=-